MAKRNTDAKFKYLMIMLRPIIRYSLKRSLTVQDFIEATKRGFIQVAIEEMEKNGEKANTSRLSVITGLTRREVDRVEREPEDAPESMSIIDRVIGQWGQDKQFVTKKGIPRILSLEGEDSEFKRLIRSISTDVKPGTVLLELERCGVVQRVKNGLQLVRDVNIIGENLESGFQLLAQDTEDLISTVEENLFGDKEVPNLHGRTEYDNVSEKDLPTIRQWLLVEGTKFHQKARAFISQYDKDINPKLRHETGTKVVLGTFSKT